jgi:hypothetical protein
MKTTRIEITVESSRLVIIHQGEAPQQAWCERCGKRVGVIRLAESEISDLHRKAVRQQFEAGLLHCTAGSDVTRLLCLESLLK